MRKHSLRGALCSEKLFLLNLFISTQNKYTYRWKTNFREYENTFGYKKVKFFRFFENFNRQAFNIMAKSYLRDIENGNTQN